MRTSTRSGFSVLDLVILLAIVAVTAAILLPAVQRSRANSAQKGTINNLRMCAIAIHNYHGTYNKLPHAAWTGGIYTGKDDQRSMWFHLTPYIEQDLVYKNNIHDAIIEAYLSPDDRSLNDKKGRLSFAGNIRVFGYATLKPDVANSAVDMKGEPSGKSIGTNLASAMQSTLTLARIQDGTSNTFMLATRNAECGSPALATYYSGAPKGPKLLATGGPGKSVGAAEKGQGGFFGAGSHSKAPGATLDATFQPTPKVADCKADDSVFGHSFGAQGLLVAICDATVKTISPTMTPTTFARGLCPSDGYPLGNDWTD